MAHLKIKKASKSINSGNSTQSLPRINLGGNFRIISPENIEVGLDDIWGHDECRKDLSNIIQYLQNPTKYMNFGFLPHFKYLLLGPNGCGKKTIACAVAKTAGLPILVVESSFFYNSNGIIEELENIFQEIHSFHMNGNSCILLIKNLEHISELEPEIQQPLIECLLAYFRVFKDLVVFATVDLDESDVNLPNALLHDSAFSKVISMDFHELPVREEIIGSLLKGKPVSSDVSIHRLALDTFCFSTGDIKEFIKEAALICLQNGKEKISYDDFSEALARSDFGYSSTSLSEEERLATARHEAGHVIAGYFSDPENYKVSKVDITPRSLYMGITQETPNEARKTLFNKDFENQIVACFGGMASEFFYYNTTSSGVAGDIQQATVIATNMVKCYGMNDQIGPISLLIREIPFAEVEKHADLEVQFLLKKMYRKAIDIVKKNSNALETLTNALLEKEVLYSDEIMAILSNYSNV